MKIGDQFSFVPSAFTVYDDPQRMSFKGEEVPVRVRGTVVQIHEEHRWLLVRYEVNGQAFYECFPLTQIAEAETAAELPHKHGYHRDGRRGITKWETKERRS